MQNCSVCFRKLIVSISNFLVWPFWSLFQDVNQCQRIGSGGKIRQLIVSLSYIAAPHNY